MFVCVYNLILHTYQYIIRYIRMTMASTNIITVELLNTLMDCERQYTNSCTYVYSKKNKLGYLTMYIHIATWNPHITL